MVITIDAPEPLTEMPDVSWTKENVGLVIPIWSVAVKVTGDPRMGAVGMGVTVMLPVTATVPPLVVVAPLMMHEVLALSDVSITETVVLVAVKVLG